MLSETKCTKSLSNNFCKRYEVFISEPFVYCTQITKVYSLENKAFQMDIYFLEATGTLNFRVYSFHSNIKLYAKYTNAIFDDQFYRR